MSHMNIHVGGIRARRWECRIMWRNRNALGYPQLIVLLQPHIRIYQMLTATAAKFGVQCGITGLTHSRASTSVQLFSMRLTQDL